MALTERDLEMECRVQDELCYDSARRPSPMLEEFHQLIRYRDLLVQLVSRNIKIRYKRSVLGVAWTMLNPLLTMTVMTFVFSKVLRMSIEHYSVFLLSALIVWNFFAQTSSSAMGELIWGSALLNRIYIPRTIFAATAVGTGLVNLLLSLIPLLILMVATGVRPTVALLFLPIPILLMAGFAAGVGLILSTLAVHFTDVMEMYQVVLTAWMYFTPIFYTVDFIPPQYRWLFSLNPNVYLVEAFRAPIYGGVLPNGRILAHATLWAGCILAVGWVIFARKAEEIVYRV